MKTTFFRALCAPLLALTLLALALFTVACKKDEYKPVPATIAPGVIIGRVNPSGSVSSVTVTDSASQTFRAVPDAVGDFRLPNLAPGAYQIHFAAAANYVSPPNRSVFVATAATTDVGTVDIPRSNIPPGSAAACNVGRSIFAVSQVRATLASGVLTVTLSNPYGASVSFVLDNVTRPGSFILGQGASTGSYRVDATTATFEWSTRYGGSGAATVMRFDTTARVVSGSFNFIAYPIPGQANIVAAEVTNGTFTNVSF